MVCTRCLYNNEIDGLPICFAPLGIYYRCLTEQDFNEPENNTGGSICVPFIEPKEW